MLLLFVPAIVLVLQFNEARAIHVAGHEIMWWTNHYIWAFLFGNGEERTWKLATARLAACFRPSSGCAQHGVLRTLCTCLEVECCLNECALCTVCSSLVRSPA